MLWATNFIAEGGSLYSFIGVAILVIGWGTWVTKRTRVAPRMSNRKMIRELYKCVVGEDATEFEPRRIGLLEQVEKLNEKADIIYEKDEVADVHRKR